MHPVLPEVAANLDETVDTHSYSRHRPAEGTAATATTADQVQS
jgi:hypothetical protein